MASDPDYADPSAWRIAVEASAGVVSMNTLHGPLPLCRLSSLHGSFRLTPPGTLIGFTLRLPLPPEPTPRPALLWEAAQLDVEGNEVTGWGRLRLGRRRAATYVSGRCAKVPQGPSGRSYLKIVLETTFPSLALRWPSRAYKRLRPATLTLFSEIRPVNAVPGPSDTLR